jgi:hypothetical protein
MFPVAARREASRLDDAEASTVEFRLRFLDASEATLRELYVEAYDVAGALALVEGFAWPAGAVRIAILDAEGREVHSERR